MITRLIGAGLAVLVAAGMPGTAAAQETTLHLDPGTDQTRQKTFDMVEGATYTFTVTGSVREEFSSANVCVLDLFYSQCNGGTPSTGYGIYISRPAGPTGQPLSDLAPSRPPFAADHSYSFTIKSTYGGKAGLLAHPNGAPFQNNPSKYTGGFDVTIAESNPDLCSRAARQTCPVKRDGVKVAKISGEAAYRTNGGPWEPLEVGRVLRADDEVFTGVDSAVTFELPGGFGTLVLDELSQMLIATFETDAEGLKRIKVQLAVGKIEASVNKEKSLDTNFEIQTYEFHSGARGTKFSVFRDAAARATLVSVTESSVFVDPLGDGLASVTLTAGQEVEGTSTSITPVAAIGQAGAVGGINRARARELVMNRLEHAKKRCKLRSPRSASAVSTKPSGAGWNVGVRVLGRAKGVSKWRVAGGKVKPRNKVARRIARNCRA